MRPVEVGQRLYSLSQFERANGPNVEECTVRKVTDKTATVETPGWDPRVKPHTWRGSRVPEDGPPGVVVIAAGGTRYYASRLELYRAAAEGAANGAALHLERARAASERAELFHELAEREAAAS